MVGGMMSSSCLVEGSAGERGAAQRGLGLCVGDADPSQLGRGQLPWGMA